MRLIARLLLVLMAVSLAFGGGYLVWVEGRLLLAAWQLQRDMGSANQWAHQGVRGRDCYGDGSGLEAQQMALSGYQVRFTDDSHYVVEAVCTDPARGPFLALSAELPLGVRKVRGSGVLIAVPVQGATLSGMVVLKTEFQAMAVGYEAGSLRWYWVRDPQTVAPGDSPAVTTCSGWGYQCCNALTEVGAGETEGRVSDCRDSCFGVCRSRPVLVFFGTDPLVDPSTRTLALSGSRASIAFTYSFQAVDGEIAEVVLNYGDGQQYTDTVGDGSSIHEYTCHLSECVYTAALSAVDVYGLEMAKTRLSQIRIVLTP